MRTPDTIEDILADPKRFGLPTLEEFIASGGKKLASDEEKLARIDKSTQVFRNGVISHKYYFENYRCRSLEEVQAICINEGVSFSSLKVKPQVEPDRNDPDKCHLIVRFERPLSALLGIQV